MSPKCKFLFLILFLILASITFSSHLSAQNNFYLKFGGNISNFRQNHLTDNKGISFGAGYSFAPISSVSAFITVELLYTSKKGTLTNKTWPSYERDVTIGNIFIDVRNLEIPIKTGYLFNFYKEIEFEIFLGPSISRRIKNKTKIKIVDQLFLDPEQKEKYKFDYYRYDADPTNLPFYASFMSYKTGLDFNVGAALRMAFIALELRYSYGLIETKNIVGLTLFEHFDSYFLYMSIEL